jgi:hypothetical protein
MSKLAFPYQLLPLTTKYVRDKNLHIYHWIGLLFGKKNLGYYFILYGYLKWVDDFIDEKNSNLPLLKTFVQRQRNICLKGIEPEKEEEYLGEAIYNLLSVSNENYLLSALEKVFDSFLLDIERREEIFFTEEKLNNRIELIGTGVIEFSEYCFAKPGTLSQSLKRKMCWLYIQTDMLLDFDEDLEIGYINISHDDIIKFNIPKMDYTEIRLGKSHSEQFKNWISLKCQNQLDLAKESLLELQELKYSLFYYFLLKIYKQRINKIHKTLSYYI